MEKIKRHLEAIQIQPKQLALGIATLMTLVVAWESRRFFSHEAPTKIESKRVLTVARDLGEGEVVTFSDLQMVPMEKLSLPSHRKVFTDQDLAWVKGRRLKKFLKSGEPLDDESLYGAHEEPSLPQIPEGYRAYFLESPIQAWIKTGSRVDLILKTPLNSQDSLILVENALVLTLSQSRENSGVLLALKPEDIDWLERNSRLGKVVLAVRNPSEGTGETGFSRRKRARDSIVHRSHRIEVITEGP